MFEDMVICDIFGGMGKRVLCLFEKLIYWIVGISIDNSDVLLGLSCTEWEVNMQSEVDWTGFVTLLVKVLNTRMFPRCIYIISVYG